MVGGLFWISAWYLNQQASIKTKYLFSLYDLQVDALSSKGREPGELILNGEKLREIASSFSSYIDYGVTGIVIAGGVLLLLALALSVFNITIDNKVNDLQRRRARRDQA